MIMVQQPETAVIDCMPRVGADDRGRGLRPFGREDVGSPSQARQSPYVAEPSSCRVSINSGLITSAILNILRLQSNVDFQAYKKGMLDRRIQRRMGLRHFTSTADYVELLSKNGLRH